jgi:type I restriction enzyme S subunit
MTVPNAWKTIRLEELVDAAWGDTSVTKKSYVEKGYTAFSATGADGFLPYFDYEKSGIVLSAIGANCGKIWLAEGRWSCIKNTMRFFVKDESTLSTKFLFHFLSDPSAFIRRGSGQPFIRQEDVRHMVITYPSIAEQERIVEILEDHLSRLDAALADVKQAKLKAAQFKLSLLNSAFTGTLTNSTEANWKKVRLIDCLEKLDSGKFAERGWSPQCLNYPVTNPNVWGVLKTTAVQMGEYQSEHNKELPNELIPKTHLKVMQGDFLMTTTGPRNRCGVICLVKATPSNLIFSGKILRFRANEKTLSSNWLMYLLMSGDYQKILNDLKVGTSDSSVSIGNKQILDLEIPLPTLSEQSRILAIIEEQMTKVDSSMKASDFIERNSEALRRSLLQAAFTGQLTKKEVNV